MRLTMIWGIAAMLAATVAWGYPNLVGTTGLLATPNTFSMPSGDLQAAIDVFDATRTTVNARAVYGVTSRFEVGAVLVAGVDDGAGLSAKFVGSEGDFRWAFGGTVITGNGNSDDAQVFIALGRAFSVPDSPGSTLQATVGIMGKDRGNDSVLRPWIGGQLVVGNTEVVGEYQFRNINIFNNEVISLAVRQDFPASNLTAQIGFTQSIGISRIGDDVIFGGIAYRVP